MRPNFVYLLAILPLLTTAFPTATTGRSIKLTRTVKLANEDGSVNIDVLRTQVRKSTSKIQRGMNAYRKNTGTQGQDKREIGSVPLDVEDQDGLWQGSITVGSPPSQFTVDFDTGSSDLVLPGPSCHTNCEGHRTYDPSTSSASHNLNENFKLSYGDGSSVEGAVYTDTVSVGGIEVTGQAVGAATQYSNGFAKDNFTPDGLMGMAFQEISEFNSPPFFQTAVEQGKPTSGEFAFKLAESGSELYLGGTNHNLYTGSFSYAPITRVAFWEVSMESVQVNGAQALVSLSAIIDTGTTLIIGDEANVATFYSKIPGSKKMGGQGGFYTFPCESVPSVSLEFGGREFPISADTFNLGREEQGSPNCVGGIVEGDIPDNSWVVGDVFLLNVYTVFDMANYRVGFATLT